MDESDTFRDTEAIAEALRADSALYAEVERFVKDERFTKAWEKLDAEKFAGEFNKFTKKVSSYNAHHRRERRLWAIRLGKGNIPEHLEQQFRETIPAAAQDFKEAFESIGSCMTILEESGFGQMLNDRSDKLTTFLSSEENVLGGSVVNYFRENGCSTEMIAEFRDKFRVTNYDFVQVLGKGKFSGLRDVMRDSVDAQVQLLEYTRKNGFGYIKGRCGPPAWAIAVAEVLAWVGITISAWAVVAIIATLVALIILICALRILPADIQSKCDFIKFSLKLNF